MGLCVPNWQEYYGTWPREGRPGDPKFLQPERIVLTIAVRDVTSKGVIRFIAEAARPKTGGFIGAHTISQHGLRCNEQIRISPVRLINELNEQVGVVPIMEALRLSREAGLDLVEVSPMERPPVCRIMDYGKWKYKQRKKEQKSHAGSHVQQLKELRIKSVKIDTHDQTTTLNKARKFLDAGHKVQFNLMFRGREMAHVGLGRQILEHFKAELDPVAKVEREPKLEGKRMILILAPKAHSSHSAHAAHSPNGGAAVPQVTHA